MLRYPKFVSLDSSIKTVTFTMSIFTETPVTQCILDYFEQELGCHPPWTNTSRLGLEQCSDDKYIKFLDVFGVRIDQGSEPCLTTILIAEFLRNG